MFLSSLSKKQKNLFMELAIKAAEVNGVVELSEKNMLKAYSAEMEIPPVYTSDCNVEEALLDMKEASTDSELRIVLFELMGILTSDNEYDAAEAEFINKVRKSFNISQEISDKMMQLLREYLRLFNEIVATVVEEKEH